LVAADAFTLRAVAVDPVPVCPTPQTSIGVLALVPLKWAMEPEKNAFEPAVKV
jgi:hypothetical protein